MENNYYNDHFEQFLKDTVDDFRMYPSKKVWTSLYNNLQPGRKWPSLPTILILLISFSFLSTEKNQQQSEQSTTVSARPNLKYTPSFDLKNLPAEANFPTNPLPASYQPAASAEGAIIQTGHYKRLVRSAAKSELALDQPETEKATATSGGTIYNLTEASVALSPEAATVSTNQLISLKEVAATGPESVAKPSSYLQGKSWKEGTLANDFLHIENLAFQPSYSQLLKIRKPFVKTRSITAFSDRETVEDLAFHQKPKSRWKGRLGYTVYATPSVGYRQMSQKSENRIYSPSLFNGPSIVSNDAYQLNHSPGLNMELGGNYFYRISKNLRIKAGVQINYTNYRIHAKQIDHPTMTTLLLNNSNTGAPELLSRSSSIANVRGGTHLNSSTFQLGIPMGADLKLAGNENIQWMVGGSIQPGLVMGGNPYLMSADMKNYIYEPGMLRRWNINSNVETFISYKLKNGATLHAGPQLRYQLLSTYKSSYLYDEKLYNIGFKIGMSRSF